MTDFAPMYPPEGSSERYWCDRLRLILRRYPDGATRRQAMQHLHVKLVPYLKIVELLEENGIITQEARPDLNAPLLRLNAARDASTPMTVNLGDAVPPLPSSWQAPRGPVRRIVRPRQNGAAYIWLCRLCAGLASGMHSEPGSLRAACRVLRVKAKQARIVLTEAEQRGLVTKQGAKQWTLTDEGAQMADAAASYHRMRVAMPVEWKD